MYQTGDKVRVINKTTGLPKHESVTWKEAQKQGGLGYVRRVYKSDQQVEIGYGMIGTVACFNFSDVEPWNNNLEGVEEL